MRGGLPGIAADLAQVVAQVAARLQGRPPEEIGAAAARAFCRRFAGCEVRLPSARSLARQERAERVWRLYQAGVGPAEIARRFGLSERHVWRVIAGKKRRR